MDGESVTEEQPVPPSTSSAEILSSDAAADILQLTNSSKVEQTNVIAASKPLPSSFGPSHSISPGQSAVTSLDGCYDSLLTGGIIMGSAGPSPHNNDTTGSGGGNDGSSSVPTKTSAPVSDSSLDFLAGFQSQPQQSIVEDNTNDNNGETTTSGGAGGENGLNQGTNGNLNYTLSNQPQYGKPASAPSPSPVPFSPGPATSRQPASVPPPFSPAQSQSQAQQPSAAPFQQPHSQSAAGSTLLPNRNTSSNNPTIIPPAPLADSTSATANVDDPSSQSIIKNMADIVNRVPDQCGLVSALSKVEQMAKPPQQPGGSASSSVSSALSPAPSIASPSTHLLAQQQQQQQSFQQSGLVPQQPLMRPNSRPSSIGGGTGSIQSPQQLQQPGSVKTEPSLQQQIMMQQQTIKQNGQDWHLQQPVIHVFNTKLANEAAEAVRQGHCQSIIEFHAQMLSQNKISADMAGQLPQPEPKSQQFSARQAAKLKEVEEVGNALGIKKEKHQQQQQHHPMPQPTEMPPGMQAGMPPGQIFQQGMPPNSPGMMPPDIGNRMRLEQEHKRRMMIASGMPPEAFGPGGGFPPGHPAHMMGGPMPHPPENAIFDPNFGCYIDQNTGVMFRPPNIASPGGPRYPSPFPPGPPGMPGGPPMPGMMPGFPMMMPGPPPPSSGRSNGPSGDQPPPKKTRKAPKKSKTESKNANLVAANNAAMAAAQHQQMGMGHPGQPHPPRLQTVPSPRQLSALADIDAQELIITRQLNAAYRDDLGGGQPGGPQVPVDPQQMMQQVHSPLSMHQLLQQQQMRQQQAGLPPNAPPGMYPGGPPQRESGRLSHGPPGKGGPIDPMFLQQQQQQEMLMHQQRIAQMGGDPNMLPPGFDPSGPGGFMMSPEQMMGYPGGPQGGPPGHPPHLGNVQIQQREQGGTVHYRPGGPPGAQGGPPPMNHQQQQHLQQQIAQQQLAQQREQQFIEENYGNPEMLMAHRQQQQQQQHARGMMMPPQPGHPQGYGVEMGFDPQQQMYRQMQQEMQPQFYEQQVLEQQAFIQQGGSPGSQEAAAVLAQQQQQQADFMYQQQLAQQLAAQQQQQQGGGQPSLQPQLPDAMYGGGMPPGADPSMGYGYGPGPSGYPGEYMGGQQQEFVQQQQQQPWLS